jgi:hypothetical protein
VQFEKGPEALSILGAGQGVVVLVGKARPAGVPLIGPPRQPSKEAALGGAHPQKGGAQATD